MHPLPGIATTFQQGSLYNIIAVQMYKSQVIVKVSVGLVYAMVLLWHGSLCTDEPMQFQHARPVTLKRADIKTQLQNTVSGMAALPILTMPTFILLASYSGSPIFHNTGKRRKISEPEDKATFISSVLCACIPFPKSPNPPSCIQVATHCSPLPQIVQDPSSITVVKSILNFSIHVC